MLSSLWRSLHKKELKLVCFFLQTFKGTWTKTTINKEIASPPATFKQNEWESHYFLPISISLLPKHGCHAQKSQDPIDLWFILLQTSKILKMRVGKGVRLSCLFFFLLLLIIHSTWVSSQRPHFPVKDAVIVFSLFSHSLFYFNTH